MASRESGLESIVTPLSVESSHMAHNCQSPNADSEAYACYERSGELFLLVSGPGKHPHAIRVDFCPFCGKQAGESSPDLVAEDSTTT